MSKNNYTVAQNIGNLWLHEVRVTLSGGKPPAWAKVTKFVECVTLASWLKGQLGTKREGHLTAEEYASSPDETKKAEKAAFHWYSFAAYTGQHRNSANWLGSNIVILDVDGKDSTGATRPFSSQKLRERLDGLRYIALPTHGYTEATPRWRIVVPLSERVTDRDEFEIIAKHLAQRLDNCVDIKSYTPEQLWFPLSAPRGAWDERVALVMVEG